MTPLEITAAAIQAHEGWYPGSRSFRNANPGNLKGSKLAHEYDADHFCVFLNYATGWQALIDDLEAKFSGVNAHGLGPDSTLFQLFQVYAPAGDNNNVWAYSLHVSHWLTVALGRVVLPNTTLYAITGGSYD